MKQPKALYLLNFVSMWECFSYYGMRVLLVLFLTAEMQLSDIEAFGLYALYTTLVEFGGVVGGILADKFFGLKRSITWGGWVIVLGHLALTIPGSMTPFYLGLGLIIAGTSLFRTNVAAFLGQFYAENDPRKDAGYTVYYTGINIGGFLASILCGIVAEVWGWHAGFGVAAFGMLLGNIALLMGSRLLEGKGKTTLPSFKAALISAAALALSAPVFAMMLYYEAEFQYAFPLIAIALVAYALNLLKGRSQLELVKLKRLGVYLIFLMLFYACEEQLGSTLVLFSERHVERSTYFGVLPAASLVTFNPLTILIIGPLLSRLIAKIPISSLSKIAMSFLLLTAAFLILYFGCLLADADGTVPLGLALMSIVAISLGEILIGPTVYSEASDASPTGLPGLTMGMVTLGFSFANLISGYLSKTMAVGDHEVSLAVYANGFGCIGAGCILLTALLFLMNQHKKVLAS